jgi:hypothetical protein
MKSVINWFLLCCIVNYCNAQVPVIKEPHHKVVLENDYVRLIDVHIQPADTTLNHIHAAASVIVFLTKTIIGSKPINGTANSSQVNPGNTSYASYDITPITHKVWNQDTVPFHVMDIEMVKQKATVNNYAVLQQPGIQMAFSKDLVTVYNLTVAVEHELNVTQDNCGYLLIGISGNAVAEAKDKKYNMLNGVYKYFAPGMAFKIINHDKAEASFVLLELK